MLRRFFFSSPLPFPELVEFVILFLLLNNSNRFLQLAPDGCILSTLILLPKRGNFGKALLTPTRPNLKSALGKKELTEEGRGIFFLSFISIN